MRGLVSFKTFSNQLSSSVALKCKLTAITFIGICIPAAILITAGYSERYVLSGMLGAIIPFQYLVFCILQNVDRDKTRVVAKTDTDGLREMLYSVATTESKGTDLGLTIAKEIFLQIPLLSMKAKTSETERMLSQVEQMEKVLNNQLALIKSIMIVPGNADIVFPRLDLDEARDSLIREQRKPLESAEKSRWFLGPLLPNHLRP